MALKITTAIGTDKGITEEAYIRIGSYNLQKAGTATLGVEIYQSKADADNFMASSKNSQIGDLIMIPLLKETEDKEGNKSYSVDLSPAIGVDIFTFGYAQLKTKLVGLFGEKNVIDC